MHQPIPRRSLATLAAGLLLAMLIPLAGATVLSVAAPPHISAPVADNPFGGGGSSGGGGASGGW